MGKYKWSQFIYPSIFLGCAHQLMRLCLYNISNINVLYYCIAWDETTMNTRKVGTLCPFPLLLFFLCLWQSWSTKKTRNRRNKKQKGTVRISLICLLIFKIYPNWFCFEIDIMVIYIYIYINIDFKIRQFCYNIFRQYYISWNLS